MLIGKTYTPPEAEATTAILPLLPDHLRAQALRLLTQLSEHGCYTEKASAGEAGDNLNITRNTYQGSQKTRAREGTDW